MEKLRIHIVTSPARCIGEPRESAGEPIDAKKIEEGTHFRDFF